MSTENFNVSSICSESDVNESLEDSDETHNLADMADEDNISPPTKLEMDIDSLSDADMSDVKLMKNLNSYSQAEQCNLVEADSNTDNPSTKRLKMKKETRQCTVCGDRALGFNFDAITCESCKAFFRRNANKSKHPRCMFQSNCTVDSNTRRFCSACRLTKCFAVGMKKEMILGDVERQQRIQKVQQNRAKKLEQLQKQTGVDVLMPSDQSSLYPLKDSPVTMDKLCSVKVETHSDGSPSSISDQALVWPFQINVGLADMDIESQDASHRLLADKDLQLVELIKSAYISTFGSTSEETPLQLESTSLEVLLNHIGTLIKLLIKFAKRLDDFSTLPQLAKETLLKGSLLDCITWRSAQIYNVEKGKWVNDEGMETPTQLLSAAFGEVDVNIQAEHVKLISYMKSIVGCDITLIALIQCAVLFTPEVAAPGTRAITSSAQEKYLILLKRYIESNNSWKDAFALYTKILTCISAARVITAKHGKVFSHCNPTQVEPLLLEVFDLCSESGLK